MATRKRRQNRMPREEGWFPTKGKPLTQAAANQIIAESFGSNLHAAPLTIVRLLKALSHSAFERWRELYALKEPSEYDEHAEDDLGMLSAFLDDTLSDILRDLNVCPDLRAAAQLVKADRPGVKLVGHATPKDLKAFLGGSRGSLIDVEDAEDE